MLTGKKRDDCLARLDALAALLDSRLGPNPTGFYVEHGIEHVWGEYEALRQTLVAADPDRFGSLRLRPEPKEDEYESIGGEPGIHALLLVALREQVLQARTLLLGGDSIDRLDTRASNRLDLSLKRLTLGRGITALAILVLTFAVGWWSRGCARSTSDTTHAVGRTADTTSTK